MLGDDPGGGEVGRLRRADRERQQLLPALLQVARRDRRHQRASRARPTGTRRRARRPSSGARRRRSAPRGCRSGAGRPAAESATPGPRARTGRARPRASRSSRAERARRTGASRGRTRASPTRSARRSPRCAQYRGLMPTGSRAATKRSAAGGDEREHAVQLGQRLRAALVDQVQGDLVVGVGREVEVARATRGSPRGCRPRRCRPGAGRRRPPTSGCLPPPTSTIESRRVPEPPRPRVSPTPQSSGPRCERRSSIRSSSSGSSAPCSATIPHMCSLLPFRQLLEATRVTRVPRPVMCAVSMRPAVGQMVDVEPDRLDRGGRVDLARVAIPSRAPVRRQHDPVRVDDLRPPGEAQRAPRPVALDDTQTTWCSIARAWSITSKWRTWRSCGDARRGAAAVDRPGRQAGDDLGAVRGQRPRRLGEQLVVAEQHPDAADGRVECREPSRPAV